MNLKKLALVAALATIGSSAAMATLVAEVGDAGQTLATAQMLGASTGVTGNLSGDADIFGFTWGGGAFYADTLGSGHSDTQLFLFNAAGAGIVANDDGLSGLRSYINPTLAAGNYFLAISGYNNDPVSASGVMFQSSPFSPQYGPLYPGQALQSWTGGGGTGAYVINFRSDAGVVVTTGDVPEPASLALLGLGLVGLVASRRKQAK